MIFLHGSCLVDLPIGGMLLPSSEAKRRANPRMNVVTIEEYDDGVTREDTNILWLCTDKDEASRWAIHPMLKSTGDDVYQEQMDRGGQPVQCIVYEVEPVGTVYRRLTPHSETEYGCDRAVVLSREVVETYDWREFAYEPLPNGWAEPYCGMDLTVTDGRWSCSCGEQFGDDEMAACIAWKDHLAAEHPESGQ